MTSSLIFIICKKINLIANYNNH